MTKALVTIEVDIDTDHVNIWRGLGENSNPTLIGRGHLQDLQRDWIWGVTYSWLADKLDFVSIKKVSLIKENEVA